MRAESWATSATSLDALGEAVFAFETHGREQALYDRGGVLVQVNLFGGQVWATAAAHERETAASAIAWARELLPAPDPSATHDVMVTFWTYGPHGAQPTWRSIGVPDWEEIGTNYGGATRGALEPLMRDFKPARGGQLVLWHGRAGTGKTYALRALTWEWREWCEFHYIVDPDTFFGQHADYLMGVLMQPTYAEMGMPMAFARLAAQGGDIEQMVFDEDEEQAKPKPWKLLILEDTGELLTADARAVIGQGLSRFLNVVDGLIGQGLRVLVLVTTNEEIRKLHPAVARPGRCAANVEFAALSAEESAAWLAQRGVERAADGATTLASLYAIAEGMDPREARSTGFAA